ncbi:DUF4249 domain-containing protein [Ancylomarina euxinus]|uniref:DUF4249 domain-containing protein n=1 Tax=Ancylomarina euxinus TaxID=2283627 RepID=A0A425XYP7_9BACT|nr:DUF4249 domain-containing protein [Ancylomarina euxinus]MCZ4695688.1 DUF4249 domain-containing protein [Ancylomarina euxinus]MUP16008.1 DUF4249 family protein [Ancylomarina euxinus]RRG20254.1 DUF4249 domain-containing protein [Ancylomarina euxinus]
MRLKVKLLSLSVLILLLNSCTEKFYPKVDDDLSILVVDGKITDGIGTCEVRLFRTVKFTDKFDLKPEINATVILHDDQDNTEILNEHEPGIYRNSSLIIEGKVESSYWIEIQTLSGEKYESTPETMLSPFEISPLYGEEIEAINDNNIKQDAIRLYFNAKNNDNTSTHLRWEYRESYEWHSPFKNSNPRSEGSTRTCFPANNFDQINVFDASKLTIKEVNQLPMTTVFDNEVKFLYNYLIDMKVYSISKENYLFWKTLKTLHQSNGSLYDVIQANIKGNIETCSDACQVLGYFEVSSVRKSQRMFNTTDFSMRFPTFPEECETFIVRMSKASPDPEILYIISATAVGGLTEYTVRLLECYECNIKYPVTKPSFWP